MPRYMVIDGKNKKWTKTSLTKWLKHSTTPQTPMTPQSQQQHTVVGNPTEVMTRNH